MAVENNNVVTLNYKLHTIEEGGEKNFVEETTTENPLTFLYGVGMMLPKFEEQISGLDAGDKKNFELEAPDAYGERDDRAIAQLPADMFQETGLPPVGEVLPLQYNQGNQFRAVVVEVTPEAVVADLNHPMAGKKLNFDIEIIETREATPEELSQGQSDGADGEEAQ